MSLSSLYTSRPICFSILKQNCLNEHLSTFVPLNPHDRTKGLCNIQSNLILVPIKICQAKFPFFKHYLYKYYKAKKNLKKVKWYPCFEKNSFCLSCKINYLIKKVFQWQNTVSLRKHVLVIRIIFLK